MKYEIFASTLLTPEEVESCLAGNSVVSDEKITPIIPIEAESIWEAADKLHDESGLNDHPVFSKARTWNYYLMVDGKVMSAKYPTFDGE